MKTKFKPTKVLETDLMKAALDNIQNLKSLVSDEYQIVFQHFHNPMNRALYRLLKKEYQKIKDVERIDIESFYNDITKMASEQIQDFNVEIYTDIYEKDFCFSKTI